MARDHLSARIGAVSRAVACQPPDHNHRINGTFYRTQAPQSSRKWVLETSEDFVFPVKAPLVAANRRIFAEAVPSIERFLASGVLELGCKLGALPWQFAPTNKFDPEDTAKFLVLLPQRWNGVELRHAIEIRNESFVTADFVAMARPWHGDRAGGI